MTVARQRVLGNTNPVKLGRCFSFLNNWYGFEKGTNQYSITKVLCSSDYSVPKNQKELAESYGITKQTMNNYMRMADMIPELEDLVDTSIVTKDTTLAYETKEEVMEWMLDIQLGRRNLSPIQRIAITEKYRPIYEKQAKENISKAVTESNKNRANPTLVNLPNMEFVPVNTSEKLASVAGVSEKTYRMGAKILNSDNKEVKDKVLSGEMSINAGYNKIKKHW